MSCTACIVLKVLLGLLLLPCACAFVHHADGVRVCLEPSNPTFSSPRRPPGRPENSSGYIALAYTGTSVSPRGQHCAIWSLPARGAARQRLQRITVFPTRLAGAERAQAHVPLRKSRRLGFRARGAASHPRRRRLRRGRSPGAQRDARTAAYNIWAARPRAPRAPPTLNKRRIMVRRR